jgi:hypothetical protein
MRTSSRFERDHIVVEEQAGTRSADGFSEGSSSTVLDADGDAQKLSRVKGEQPASLEAGGLVFYAAKDVSACRAGMDATITLEDGTVLGCTVERVLYEDSSLELSLDG